MKTVFYGQFDYTLEEKGRLIVPARFREAFQEGAVLITGPNGYICVYPPKEAEKFPPSQMWKVELDKEGRILLPQKLIESAFLGREVTWFGETNHLEIRPRKPVPKINAFRAALQFIKKEVIEPMKASYKKITIEEAQDLHRHGFAVKGDGDHRVLLIKPE